MLVVACVILPVVTSPQPLFSFRRLLSARDDHVVCAVFPPFKAIDEPELNGWRKIKGIPTMSQQQFSGTQTVVPDAIFRLTGDLSLFGWSPILFHQ